MLLKNETAVILNNFFFNFNFNFFYFFSVKTVYECCLTYYILGEMTWMYFALVFLIQGFFDPQMYFVQIDDLKNQDIGIIVN